MCRRSVCTDQLLFVCYTFAYERKTKQMFHNKIYQDSIWVKWIEGTLKQEKCAKNWMNEKSSSIFPGSLDCPVNGSESDVSNLSNFVWYQLCLHFTCFLSGIPDMRSQVRLSQPWPHLGWRALTWRWRPGGSWGWGRSTRPRVQGGREGRPGNVRDV